MNTMYAVFENKYHVVIVDLAYKSHAGFVVVGQRRTRSAALFFAAMYVEGVEHHGYTIHEAIGYANKMSPAEPPPPPAPMSEEERKLVDEVAARIDSTR